MNHKEYTSPANVERYTFLWSEARLVVAAVALLIGGVPPVYLMSPPALFGIVRLGLIACWIISGVASAYLLYRWYNGGQKVFGGKDGKDTIAFLVLAISGINLGLAGILGKNIGMSILSGRGLFFIVALVYLASAIYLHRRWSASGQKLFT